MRAKLFERAVVTTVLALDLGGAATAVGEPCEVASAHLRDDLAREATRTRTWTYGWAIGYAAATAGQLALTEAHDAQLRDSLYVGAGESALGALAQLVAPVAIDVPAATADACADLAALRVVQAKAGRDERNAFWLSNLGGLAVNLGGFAILAADHEWSQGALSFAIGYAVSLTQTYSLPRAQWHAWRALAITPLPGGVAIIGQF